MKSQSDIEEDDGDGLDSLLDTMTNVVGILVMVLIATQLGVKDAVDRIAQSEKGSQESVQMLEEQYTSGIALQQQLEERFKDLKTESVRQVELANLRQRLESASSELQDVKAEAQLISVKLTEQRKAAEKNAASMEAQKKEKERLTEEISENLEDEAMLKALLSDYEGVPIAGNESLTLPNPRSVPEGAKQFTLLCKANKIYPLFFNEQNRKVIRESIEFIVQQRQLFRGPELGVNHEILLPIVNQKPLTDEYFVSNLIRSGIYPRISFTPRASKGIALQEVLGTRSRFSKFLDNFDRNRFYMRFFVYPDSLEVYMAARKAADKRGILAGWEPQDPEWVYTTHLGGDLLFGAKPPPPKPNPNPAPPRPAPKLID